jgi:hypothetical protein
MRKELAAPFGIGIGIILILAAASVFFTRGAHIELTGAVLKVRTVAIDEKSSLAVVDFRFANPADAPFMVRSCLVEIVDSAGTTQQGVSLPELDARQVFDYYKTLGKKYNDSLVMKDRIPAHNAQDRMIAVRFDVPVEKLDARRRLLVRIEDVDGPVSELLEKKR